MSIEQVLAERAKTHGEFKNHAAIAQSLKDMMRIGSNWHKLSSEMREALEMIQHKIARILNGDPEVKDHWTDIIGYAKLIEQTLKEPNANK